MENNDYSEIGQLLRHAREELRFSVAQVSQQLHIRPRYVEALEQGKLKDLPGLTYTKGYLQAYALFLGLDKDEILRRFEQIETVLARKGFYFPQVISRSKSPAPVFVWGGLGLALVAYLTWAVLQPANPRISLVERFPAAPAASVANPQDVPCARAKNHYYPPCTTARARPLAPKRRQLNSVMELAKPYSRL